MGDKNRMKHESKLFLILTFIMSWGIWIPINVFGGLIPDVIEQIIVMVGMFSPTAVAFYLWSRGDKISFIGNIKASLKPNFGGWLIPMIFVFSAFTVISHGINTVFGVGFPVITHTPIMMLVIVVLQLLFVLVSMEFGWRGYLAPRVQKMFGDVPGGMAVGFAWAIWQYPAFQNSAFWHYSYPFSQFLVTLILLSIFIALFQGKNHNSIWPGVLIHGFINSSFIILPFMDKNLGTGYLPWIAFNGLTLILLVGILLFKYKIKNKNVIS